LSYKIKVAVPSHKTSQGIFLAAEEEMNTLELDLSPLEMDLQMIISMLDSLNKDSTYAVDEVNLTASVTKEESGEKSARISVGWFQLGGEGAYSKGTHFAENRLLEIKIKRKSD
jgi:hypothetical protein